MDEYLRFALAVAALTLGYFLGRIERARIIPLFCDQCGFKGAVSRVKVFGSKKLLCAECIQAPDWTP